MNIRWAILLVVLALLVGFLFVVACGDDDDDSGDDDDDSGDDDDDDSGDDDDDTDISWKVETIDNDSGYLASIDCDSQGAVHVAFYDSDYEGLMYANNKTKTWQKEKVADLDLTSMDILYKPVIQLDTDGHVHIVYVSKVDTVPTLLRATNASGSWATEAIKESGNIFQIDFALDSNDDYHITHGFLGTGVEYFTNKTGSWDVTLISDIGHEHAIAIDKDNDVHICYSEMIRLVYTNNKSGSWSDETIREGDGQGFLRNTQGLSIAMDSYNKAHVSFYDTGEEIYEEGPYYSTNASGTWESVDLDPEFISSTALASSIAIDSDGFPHIVMRKSFYGIYATNKYGNWVVERMYDMEGNLMDGRFDMALDSEDYIHMVYGYKAQEEPERIYHIDYVTNK